MGETRKLAAILAADVTGYSRLMGDDEAATVRTLTEYRQVFTDHSARHGGRIVDTAGDSVLAVFGSAVEAVECAAEIQKVLGRRNRQLAEHRRMQFRIGINLGDLIARDDGTVYGDGVNIAARLESLADPGGVCVSGTVYDHIEGKILQSFEFIGEQAVKNISKPVPAYSLVMGTHPGPSAPEDRQSARKPSTSSPQTRASPRLITAVTLLVMLAGGVALWIWFRGTPDNNTPPTRRAAIQLAGRGGARVHYPWFALSAGGLLVYTTQGTTEPMLFRQLDAPAAQPIDGTSGGTTPFLSPSGQMLGFTRAGEMLVVPTSGGPVTQVKDAAFLATGGRPAWTADGRIIYTSEHGALVMVRPDGTPPEQLTTPAEGTQHISPTVLPDGRTVLFTEVASNINDARIAALSLSDRRTRLLVSGGALTPQYADGFLFYCRPDGALMAAPFDAARAELAGQAQALPDRVDRSRFGVAHYAAAPGVLLYAPYAQTRLIEMETAGAVSALTGEGKWHMPRYSPDGTRVLFDLTATGAGDRDVWTLSRADRTLSRVTRIGDAHDPTWLSNGKEISFTSFKSAGGPLLITAADGSGEPRPLPVAGPFPRSALANPGAWLPGDSAYLAGVVEGSGYSNIWRLPRDGTHAVKLVGGPFDELSPSVSADGRWLAYQSNETGRPEVYVRPLSGAGGRLHVSRAGATSPVWDKRGLTLYYLETDGVRLHLVAASLRMASALAVASRKVILADLRLQEVDNHPNFDVDPSGTKFVMPEQAPTTGIGAVFDVATSLRGAEGRRKTQ